MTIQTELFEFLCELIDIQIKKYVALASFGVGPDARMNGYLVFEEVNELLQLTQKLQEAIDEPSRVRTEQFDTILKQVHFYVEQEYLRARAGWLLDDNQIHSPALHRITAQLDELKNIAHQANTALPQPSVPQSVLQEQCQHDSNEIAFLILDLAKKVKADPNMEIDAHIVPKHAIQIIKRNATSRYCQENIYQEIEQLREQCEHYLQQSTRKKEGTSLEYQTAKSYQEAHNKDLTNLLTHYKEHYPDAKLFQPEHQWYKIGNLREAKPSLFSEKNVSFFTAAIVSVGAIAASMLITYFSQVDEDQSLGNGL